MIFFVAKYMIEESKLETIRNDENVQFGQMYINLILVSLGLRKSTLLEYANIYDEGIPPPEFLQIMRNFAGDGIELKHDPT